MSDKISPAHYKNLGAKCPSCGHQLEAIDVTEALGFVEGNIVKYVVRWRQKDGLDDLKKASWYLNRLIAKQTPADIPTPEKSWAAHKSTPFGNWMSEE